MAKTGRNEPCPCGSGKKYKHCCLRKEQEAERAARAQHEAEMDLFAERYEAVKGALDWLLGDGARRDFILDGFYEGDRELGRQAAADRIAERSLTHWALLAEWALAEGADGAEGIEGVDGRDPAGFAKLVLAECPAALSPAGRAWIGALEGSFVSFYEIRGKEPGRLLVQDLVSDGAKPEWIEWDKEDMERAELWDIAGFRLLPGEGLRLPAIGMFNFGRSLGLKLAALFRDDLRRNARRRQPVDPRLKTSVLCLQAWLLLTYGPHLEAPPSPEAQRAANEEACFVKDLYRVDDWDAVKQAFAGQKDILDHCRGREDWAWSWIRPSAPGDGQGTVRANMYRTPEGLRVDCQSREQADAAGRRIASALGTAAVFASRTVESLEDGLKRRLAEDPAQALCCRSGLSPDAEDEVIRQVLGARCERWMDLPLPALAGRTPRHAAALDSRKAKVAELLRSMEYSLNERAQALGQKAWDIGFIWKELGLER